MAEPNAVYLYGPFVVGRTYVVLQDFECLRDRFTAGETLRYDRTAHSHYDGYRGYFFSDTVTGRCRSWDVGDHEDTAVWRTLFKLQD